MEVEYMLTQEDMKAFLRYYKESRRGKEPVGPHLRGILWPLVVIVVTILLLLVGETGKEVFRGFVLLFMGAGLGLMGVFVVALVSGKMTSRALTAYLEDPHNFWKAGPIRATISANGMTVACDHSVGTDQWSIVWKIAVTADHAFFFIASDQAHVIPRRAFRDPQEFEQFIALARSYQQGNPPSTDITTAPAPSTAITRDFS